MSTFFELCFESDRKCLEEGSIINHRKYTQEGQGGGGRGRGMPIFVGTSFTIGSALSPSKLIRQHLRGWGYFKEQTPDLWRQVSTIIDPLSRQRPSWIVKETSTTKCFSLGSCAINPYTVNVPFLEEFPCKMTCYIYLQFVSSQRSLFQRNFNSK